MKRVIIIHPSFLVGCGLSAVVSSVADRSEVKIEIKPPTEALPPDDGDESSTRYIISAGVFASAPGFFLSRRARCLIIAKSEMECGIGERGLSVISEDSAQARVMECVAELLGKPESLAGELQLSGREVEVLREIAAGKSFKEIADSLCISLNTVMTHRKNISSKLGIRSTSGLALYALMNGLI